MKKSKDNNIQEIKQVVQETKKYNSIEEYNKDLDEIIKLANEYINQYCKK